MSLTIKDLRRAMRGLPDDTVVLASAFDNSPGEIQGSVDGANVFRPGDDDYIDRVSEFGAGRPVLMLRH